jgi:hypothetical protein
MHKSINGLAALVENELALSPMKSCLCFAIVAEIKSNFCIGSEMALLSGINA